MRRVSNLYNLLGKDIKYLKYKLNVLIDKYRNYEDESFFHILRNLLDCNKIEQKAIQIVSEESQEKTIYLEEFYKDKYINNYY